MSAVDPLYAQWLMAETLWAVSTDATLAARWGSTGQTSERATTIANRADAAAEAARQIAFLSGGGPLVVDEHQLVGEWCSYLGRVITITGDQLGYDAGVGVFVIGVADDPVQQYLDRYRYPEAVMANILILSPLTISAVTASRGSGAANLLTRAPKEAWVDSAVGSAATIDIDLGAAQSIDTVYLGYVSPPAAGAVWTITGGLAGYTETTLKASGALRAVDSASRAPSRTHALWTGGASSVRYIRISITQPAGNAVLSAGILAVGAAWRPTFNMELGHGRRVIDTGSATSLPDGGFATVDGARKRQFSWSLGDLSIAEADALEELLLRHGQTAPLLVVEDPAATTGQYNRIHYGLFTDLKAYERADPGQTKWAFVLEEWI